MTQAARVVPAEQVTWNAGTFFESARPGKNAAARGIQQNRKSEQFRLKTSSPQARPSATQGKPMTEVEPEQCRRGRCLESKVYQAALLRQHGPRKATRNTRKTMHKHQKAHLNNSC